MVWLSRDRLEEMRWRKRRKSRETSRKKDTGGDDSRKTHNGKRTRMGVFFRGRERQTSVKVQQEKGK